MGGWGGFANVWLVVLRSRCPTRTETGAEEWLAEVHEYSDRPIAMLIVALRIYVRARATAREVIDPVPQEAWRMTPNHPRWGEFVHRLSQALGPPTTHNWPCEHDHDHAQAVLAEMGFSFAESKDTVLYFQKHGGGCYC